MEWEGTAAAAADAALRQTAELGRANGEVGQRGGLSVQATGVAFEEMRSRVAYVDPGEYGFWDGVGDVALGRPMGRQVFGQSDYLEAIEANRAADAAANAALKAYEDQARQATEGFPDPTPGAPSGPGSGIVGGGGGGGGVPTGAAGHGLAAPAAPPSPAGGAPSLTPAGLGAGEVPNPGAVPAIPGGSATGVPRPGDLGSGAVHPAGATVPMAPLPPAARNVPATPGLPSNLGVPTARPVPGSGFPGLAGPLPGVVTGRAGGLPTSTGRSFRSDLLRSGGRAAPVSQVPQPGHGSAEPAARSAGAFRSAGPAGAPGSAMYPPAAGAGGRSQEQPRKSRFVIPSSEPFDVDVPFVDPVIGGAR